MEKVRQDTQCKHLKNGVEAMIRKRYNDRKNKVKACWEKSIRWFQSEKHKKSSTVNTENRAKQIITSRGGTSTYSNACFKHGKTRLQVYFDAHTDRNGNFNNPTAKQNYYKLKAAFEEQYPDEIEPTPEQTAAIFYDVLGARRGHRKDIGRKPSSQGESS